MHIERSKVNYFTKAIVSITAIIARVAFQSRNFRVAMLLRLFLVLLCSSGALSAVEEGETGFQEENWGDGLKVLVTYRPKSCTHRAQQGDVIHYHYVGRLASDGTIFGKRYALF